MKRVIDYICIYGKSLIFPLFLIHCSISIYYGIKLPWGGDEWYTYNDYVLTGTPNNWLVMLLKIILGPVNVTNYIYYRQVGLFWTSFIYLFSFFILQKDSFKNYHVIILVFLLYFTFSPFIIFQEQMFRYYGLYLLYSFFVNVSILRFNENYKSHRWILYALLLLSLPVHALLTLQLVFYICWKEFSLLSLKFKKTVGSILVLLISLSFFWIGKIIKWGFTLITDSHYHLSSSELKGFSLSSLFKPIISLFHYFFGVDILPSENIFILVVFGLLLCIVISSVVIFIINNPIKKSLDFLSCSLVPLVITFFVLQSFTFPGSTQLESKHTMFAIFWIIYFLLFGYQAISSVILKNIFIVIPAISVFYGLIFALTIRKEDWKESVKVSSSQNKNSFSFTDGPSGESFRFYSNGIIDSNCIFGIWDTILVAKMINNLNEIGLTFTDYKSYQILSKEQMWNSGTGSSDRNFRANFILNKLHNLGYKAIESYSHYPLMTYHFTKTKLIQPIPWFYSYAYADLHLPVTIEKDTVLGWFPYQSGDTIPIIKPFYYMIESSGAEKITFELIKSDKASSQLVSKAERDKFRSHFCMAINGYDKKVKEWHKRPLLSSSLAYPGSYLPGTGYIYQFNPKTEDKALVVKEKDVKVWFGVEK